MTMLARRATVGPQVECERCHVHFQPRLTRWACPVCDADVPNAPTSLSERAWADPDTRVLAIVIAATVVNLILLAVLTLVALN